MAKELNQTSFTNEVLKNNVVALIDFWAPWCGPCRMMGPIIENLARKYDGKVLVAKVNVDEEQELAAKYNIMSIPSLLFFKNGNLVHTHIGATTETDLENQIKKYLL